MKCLYVVFQRPEGTKMTCRKREGNSLSVRSQGQSGLSPQSCVVRQDLFWHPLTSSFSASFLFENVLVCASSYHQLHSTKIS